MYDQTVIYGLLSEKYMDKMYDSFNVKEAITYMTNTNSFLKRFMEEYLNEVSERHLTFDELKGFNVVEILMHMNTDLILAIFNCQTGKGREGTVINTYRRKLECKNTGLEFLMS